MHEDGGMSSQPAIGNEDKASVDVHAILGSNSSLQVIMPDVTPMVPGILPSPAWERQLAIASPSWEPDNLDGRENDLDEMHHDPFSSASAPP